MSVSRAYFHDFPVCCGRARVCTDPANIRLMHHLNAALRAHAWCCTSAMWNTSCARK